MQRKVDWMDVSEFGFADKFLESPYRNEVIYVNVERSFYIWDGRRYVPEHASPVKLLHFLEGLVKEVEEQIRQSDIPPKEKDKLRIRLLRLFASRRKLNRLKQCIARKVAVKIDKLDEKPYLINTRNGVLDLETMQLMPHDKSLRITNIAFANYNPAADCPMFKQFLQEILYGDDELVDFVQRAFGYAITGFVDEKKVFYLYGGNTIVAPTLMSIVGGVMGSYYAITTLEHYRKFWRVMWWCRTKKAAEIFQFFRGVRILHLWSSGKPRPLDGETVAGLTRDDWTSVDYGEWHTETYKPTIKAFIVTPCIPDVSKLREITRKRVVVIPLNPKVAPKIDRYFADNILEEERDGIFAWLVEGYRKYRERWLSCSQNLASKIQPWGGDLV